MDPSAQRSVDQRLRDVRNLVDAARSLVEDREVLSLAIASSTGLSQAGVRLALTDHLEVDVTDDELRRLIERAGTASKVTVILSSNVFVGALRAIAIGRAASSDVVVRPSRRDPFFARALVSAAADPCLRLEQDIDIAQIDHGEIHVYGNDDTIAEIRRRGRPDVRVVGHGSGMGIAWLSSSASIDESARDLARDIVVFDQRGCLSPRVVSVEGDLERTDAFADALHRELERLALVVPRGPLPADVRAESDRYVATMTYACRALVGVDHAIGVAPAGSPMVGAPAYRHVHVVSCARVEDAEALFAPLRRSIVAVGSDDLGKARRLAPPWARISALGRMQKPPLDGPVDLR